MGRKSISHIRKPEILRHTYKVVEEEGFKGMTIGKIAKRMGVNSGLLIHYFKSKEGLIMEMVDFLYESSMNHYLKELETLTSSRERMETLLEILFDTSGTWPQRDAVFWSCYAMGFRDEKIRERIRGMMLKFIEFGIEEISGWEETGLASVEDKKKAAAKIFALSEGFGIVKNSVDDPDLIKEIADFFKNTTLKILNCRSTFNQVQP
ncbi:TetR/AcrR family transcriptional regulator [Desulfobacter vibrioformis]|uniref:TetR/AcrR family transcriptional regulator n=1 Tax=Desulfobacter vibrioformis TaxID=34031 RepID=UPI0005502544|nr:TetR/AcrR family transcriptional regulator [Desulfobacter vibrioformis]